MVFDTLVTNDGMNQILNRTFGDATSTKIKHFSVSDNDTQPTTGDTVVLENVIPISGSETVDDCETADWTQSADATAETLNSSSFKEGSNSLNLGKDGTASTTASYNKTTTSVDGTDKDLMVWVYIEDITELASAAAVTIRFGSDSSSYYQKAYAQSVLSDGWNFLKIAIDAGFDSESGGPVIGSLDYSYIAFETTDASDTIALGDLRMDFWQLGSSDDYLKVYTPVDSTTYPNVETATLKVTTRGFLSTTEANGHNIRRVGFLNEDATGDLYVSGTFESFSKSNTDLLSFELQQVFMNKQT